MKKSKKLLVLVLVLSYMCIAAACTNKDKNETPGSMAGSNTQTESGADNSAANDRNPSAEDSTNNAAGNGAGNETNHTADDNPSVGDNDASTVSPNEDNAAGSDTAKDGSLLEDAGDAVGNVVDEIADGVSDITNDIVGGSQTNKTGTTAP